MMINGDGKHPHNDMVPLGNVLNVLVVHPKDDGVMTLRAGRAMPYNFS